MEFHLRIHESIKKEQNVHEVVMSCDGIAKAKSSPESLTVFSIRFLTCRVVYPISILRPTSSDTKVKMLCKEMLDCLVDELK